MSFSDLLLLLFFVLFVVLPSFNRNRQRGPAAPGRGPSAGGQRRQALPGRPPATSTPEQQRMGPAEAGDPDEELARRIAEARARVREAMGGSDTNAERPRQPLAPPAPQPVLPSGTLSGSLDPRARARAPLAGGPTGSTVLRSGSVGPTRQSSFSTARPLQPSLQSLAQQRTARLKAGANAIEVERIARVPISASHLQAMSLERVREALVWREILGPPQARRRLGGGPYQVR